MAEQVSTIPLPRRGSSYSSIPEQRLSNARPETGGSDPETKRSSRYHRLGTSEGMPTDRSAFNDHSNDGDDKGGDNGNPINGFSRDDSTNNTGEGHILKEKENLLDTKALGSTVAIHEADGNNKDGNKELPAFKSPHMSNSFVKHKSTESVVSAPECTPIPHNGSSQDFRDSQMPVLQDSGRNKFASRLGTGFSKSNKSRMSVLSKTSFYYHGDIVDENLLLSAARIDSTLLRLFSRSRDGEHTKKVLETEDKLLPFLNYSDSDLISMDAVLWRVHPMESVHKETLEQEMSYLEENIKPIEILRRLYMDEVLTHMDYNTITRTEGQGERAVTRLLMKMLMRRGDKAFPGLISALQALQYGHVSERLQDAALKLRMAMQDEKRERQFSTTFSRQHQHGRLEIPQSSRNLLSTATFSSIQLNDLDQSHHIANDNVNGRSMNSPNIHQHEETNTAVLTTNGYASEPKPASPGVDEGKLQDHLNSLDKELKALHDDVSALKTARTQSIATGRNSTLKQPTESQIAADRVPPKSSSCTVL